MDELLLEIGKNIGKGSDGVLLRGMGRAQFDSLCGGLVLLVSHCMSLSIECKYHCDCFELIAVRVKDMWLSLTKDVKGRIYTEMESVVSQINHGLNSRL
jgi:hypothetical protein